MKQTKDYSRQKFFAQKLSNVFLCQKGIKVFHGYDNIAYVNVRTKKIYFDFSKIFKDEDVFSEMMTFKGLLFHEIHHIKHTVNGKKYLAQEYYVQNLIQILEDGRIETLAVLKYRKLADYFLYSINNVLLQKKDSILKDYQGELINMYILSFGRKIFWQDMDLLIKLREGVILKYGKDNIEKIEGLIDNFIYEKSGNKRVDIALEIAKIIKPIMEKPSDFKENLSRNISSQIDSRRSDPKTMSTDMRELKEIIKKAKIVSMKITKELQEKTKDAKDLSKDFMDNLNNAQEELDKKISELDIVKKDMNNSQNEKEYQENRKRVDELVLEKIKASIKLKNSRGYSPDGFDELMIKIEEMVDEIDDKQDDLIEKNMKDLIDDIKSTGTALEGIYADNTFSENQKMKDKSRQLEKGLKKMNTELVNGYVRKQKSGRLHMRTYLNRKNVGDTKIFKKYIPSRIKETKMLVNLFLDGSGSMQGHDRWGKALNSLWIINDALNKDNNKIMAYQFSVNYKLFKEYDGVLIMPSMVGGGTNPSSALSDAFPKIEKYRKVNGYNNVIDIIITDGIFDNESESDNMIKNLNNAGHHTILINVDAYSNRKHNAQHVFNISNFDDLVPQLVKIFNNIKKSLIRKVM